MKLANGNLHLSYLIAGILESTVTEFPRLAKCLKRASGSIMPLSVNLGFLAIISIFSVVPC